MQKVDIYMITLYIMNIAHVHTVYISTTRLNREETNRIQQPDSQKKIIGTENSLSRAHSSN